MIENAPTPRKGGWEMTELLVSSPQKDMRGESPMIDCELWTEVHARFRRGQGKRTSARDLGLDRKTVKRILAQERPGPYRRTVPRPSVVTPDLDYIQRRAVEIGSNAGCVAKTGWRVRRGWRAVARQPTRTAG